MGKKLALVNKLKRREKKVRSDADAGGFDRQNKMNREEETMAKSPSAYQLMRKHQRRLDRNFGVDAVGQEPKISKRENASTVARFDFGSSDFGTRVTMAAGLIADMGVRPNDIVFFLEGFLKGQYLKVTSVVDSTHLRLEDSATLNYPGAKEKTKVTTVADSAGSLNSKYLLLNSPSAGFYVWYNVNSAGVDPAVGGRTGIEVDVATGATAIAIATATAAAVDAQAAFVAASSQNEVYIENAAVGTATDAVDGGAPTAFTFAVLTQGAAANATRSESNTMCRFQLSDVKASYS